MPDAGNRGLTEERPVAASPPPDEPAAIARRKSANPVRRTTLIVLAIGAVLFLYSLIADRFTPYSSQAIVQAYLVRVAPEVGGKVIEVAVETDQLVEAGAVLFRIDPEPYALAVRRAEAQLEAAGQSVGASTAAVAAAQAKLAEAVARRENERDQAARTGELVKRGVYSQARGTQARTSLDAAEATVAQAESELEQARQSLGPQGAANPQIRDAMLVLQQANLDLLDTTVLAPSDGGVTNLSLALGQVLGKGEAAMTYIDIREVWIEAAFRENSLEKIRVGAPVEVVLDILPGRVFSGSIDAIGYGVSNRSVDPATGLPSIRHQSGWIRPPQPMPVRIKFETGKPLSNLRYGSQVDVMVYPTDSSVLNAIAWLRLRLVALLAYVH
jgi:multidrug resistance efflux pump